MSGKLTTGGFFRALFRCAVTGQGENPIERVMADMKEAANVKEDEKATVIETEAQEGRSD